ncbi:DUF4328 domain-containing protein [Streptomyces sp. NBC_00335]|uniref:DUF4328 domain-containing protein n=1 Tax=unclassified Streptomyces TaxID=2593676 RepID=UPI0022577DEA|nr:MULTISPECIES: DUF4328 domain-containing protein [unclassified Streptomyces]MCX5403260.1 DUF4328 domain-containing protein [Streptomyces sp. NBC_00086]
MSAGPGSARLSPLGAPPARSLLRSPKGLATALTVLLGLCALTRLLAVAAGVNRYFRLDEHTEPVGLGHSGTLLTISVSLFMTAMIPAAVVFIVWFHRVRVNAGVYARGAIRGGAGWAIGVWFIPVVGWTVLPCLIAMKVWAASASRLPGKAALTSPAPVFVWAGTFGAAMVASVAANRSAATALSDDAVRDAVLFGAASDLIYAVAAVAAILFVRRLSALQSAA